MKIAVATTDGINVNEHFGRAETFQIYVITSDGPVKVEEKVVTPLSTGDRSHSFDAERFQSITGALKGCDKIYITQIGERPAEELKKLKIEPVVYQGKISSISNA